MEDAQRIAAKTVRRVISGVSLQAALDELSTSRVPDGALVRELTYGTLRFLGQTRGLVDILATRPIADDNVAALLWVALYQLIHTTAPAATVVDCAVRATSRIGRTSAQGLTNAILRNFLRRRAALLSDVMHSPEARFSYPGWWIDRVRRDYSEHYAAILDGGNVRPPLTLRVNRRAIARDTYLAALTQRGIAGHAVGESGITLTTPTAVSELPGYAEGWFSVQDAGAQLAAPLLNATDGMRVLDACAAPGGKTMHLAELAALDLTAIDVDAGRLDRVAENLGRLHLTAKLVAADAADPAAWWDGTKFDRIMIDAPCTASGVVRRHPDAKWSHRESDVDGFAGQQRRLLDALWPCLERGGTLLYITCSVFRAENDEQVNAFGDRHEDALREDIALPPECHAIGGQLLPAPPGAAHNHDGFFYALLRKN